MCDQSHNPFSRTRNRFHGGGGYTGRMKIALSVKLTVDRKRLLESRWVHDTAHALVFSVERARKTEDGRRQAPVLRDWVI